VAVTAPAAALPEVSMGGQILVRDVAALVRRIPEGAKLAVAKTECGAAMEATRALIRRGVRGLYLIAVPSGGLQVDLLIGAGCVDTVDSAGVSMGEYGQAPCFGRAVRAGTVTVRDATCPAVYAGLQAAEKGIPFMPLRGLIGSDLVAYRDDYQVVPNPFAADDPIIAIKAIRPDVALIHAPLADRQGNVWIGRHRPLMLLAHAAGETLVTVEAMHDGNLLDDPRLGPATIPALYVTAIARAERGAWPLGLVGYYDEDADHIAAYMRLAATPEGLAEYLERYVRRLPVAAE
jgi:glutaconate CoA-transferase subunit A